MSPIRVLHITTFMDNGGIESMLMNYYRHIDRSRIQFDFLLHPSLEFQNRRGQYWDEIESLGGHIYQISGACGIVSVFGYIKKLHKFFREHPYKIIHTHWEPDFCKIPLWVAKQYGEACCISHSHGSEWKHSFPHKCFYGLMQLWYGKAENYCLACSDDAAVSAWGPEILKRDKYLKIYNAIEVEKFQFSEEKRKQIRKTLEISSDDFVIGTIGRMDKNKNQTFLIDVFVELIKLKPKSKLLLVGDGATRLGLEQKVKDLKLKNLVIFTGTRTDVPALYSAMDIFCLPSFFEGLGIVNIEAQCSGLPCLVSDGVPLDCKILEDFEYYPLSLGSSAWAKKIVDFSSRILSGRTIAIGNEWNIKRAGRFLEKFYLSQCKDF